MILIFSEVDGSMNAMGHVQSTQRVSDARSQNLFEPRHDKTNKVTVRRAKTQISLGIRPV